MGQFTKVDVLRMEQNQLYNQMAKCNDVDKCADMMMRIDEIDDILYELVWE